MAAPITDDMICSSEEAAMANPAIAYVERVAAKLEATASANVTVEGKEVTLNGSKITLIPTITGMKFVDTNPASYLLKDITGVDASWNDATNYRSYWFFTSPFGVKTRTSSPSKSFLKFWKNVSSESGLLRNSCS